MSTPKAVSSDKLAIQRQLKIKTGAVKRLFKEHNLYRKEAGEQQVKLDRIVSENGEEWDIKNAKRIFEESQRMIKDSGDRLRKAVQELTTLVDSLRSRPEFFEDEELLGAENGLTEANEVLLVDEAS